MMRLFHHGTWPMGRFLPAYSQYEKMTLGFLIPARLPNSILDIILRIPGPLLLYWYVKRLTTLKIIHGVENKEDRRPNDLRFAGYF